MELELKRATEELKKLTGLSFSLTCNTPEEYSYAIKQVKALISAYKEKNDQHTIFKMWITGSMESQELFHSAKRLRIPLTAQRALFLIDSRETIDDSVLSILSNAFPDSLNNWLVLLHSHQIALVRTFPRKITEKKLQEISYLLMDLLNTEALLQVKISYSSSFQHLEELPSAYEQAKLTLNVGKIFYTDQNIFPPNKLGIGRIIYGLAKEQCIAYLEEACGSNYADIFHSETIHSINCFFDNNLNIAETARQLHMHRNTFIYRLEQIEKETGLDIRQFDDAMTVKTALYVLNYLQSL